jgi:hypothetical protein
MRHAPKERSRVSEQDVIGIYASMSKAEEAVYKLDWGGFPTKQVSIRKGAGFTIWVVE